MNTEAIKAEITNVIAAFRDSLPPKHKRQYNAAKWQIERLTELGIIELMPTGFQHGDAGAVIKAAESATSADAARNAGGDFDVWTTSASELYKLLNEQPEPEFVEVSTTEEAETVEAFGVVFRIDAGNVDGEDCDDNRAAVSVSGQYTGNDDPLGYVDDYDLDYNLTDATWYDVISASYIDDEFVNVTVRIYRAGAEAVREWSEELQND